MMKNKLLLKRGTSLFDTYFPIFASLVVCFLLFVFGVSKLSHYLIALLIGFLFIFITRNNAVKIYLYEDFVILKFYLLNKELRVFYNEIREIVIYHTIYEGVMTKFVIINNNKKIVFRINKSDKEFINLLRLKTNLQIN